MTAQKRKSRSLEFVQRVSSIDQVYRKLQDRSDDKLGKSLHSSLLDLYAAHRTSNSDEHGTVQVRKQDAAGKQQQQQSQPRRRSIIKTADIPRSVSKKSVTFASFASVFSLPDNEHERDQTNFHHEPSVNQKTIIGKDFVIIIRSRQPDDETMSNSSDGADPYALVPKASAPQDQIVPVATPHPRRSVLHNLIHHHHHHHEKSPPSVQTLSVINRAHSTPSVLLASTSSTASPSTADATGPEQPARNFGTWLKSSSFGRFVKLLTKHSQTSPRVRSATTKRKKLLRSPNLH